MRDGRPVEPQQINARVGHYPDRFEKVGLHQTRTRRLTMDATRTQLGSGQSASEGGLKKRLPKGGLYQGDPRAGSSVPRMREALAMILCERRASMSGIR